MIENKLIVNGLNTYLTLSLPILRKRVMRPQCLRANYVTARGVELCLSSQSRVHAGRAAPQHVPSASFGVVR